MKTFRITYTICHGEYTYAEHSFVDLPKMDRDDAIRAVGAEWFLPQYSPQELKAFCREYRAEGFAWIDGDRGIADIRFEEIPPISITVSDGLIENIVGIPEGCRVEIRDRDADAVAENGVSAPEVTVWEHDGQWAPGCQ